MTADPDTFTSAVATRKGDDGTTGLLYGGQRIPKDDLRTEAFGEAVAAIVEARIAYLLVDADGFLDPELGHPFAGGDAGLVFGLAEIKHSAELLRELGAAGIDDNDRYAGRNRVLDRSAERGGVRNGNDQAVRL